jgi:hypothetical protein
MEERCGKTQVGCKSVEGQVQGAGFLAFSLLGVASCDLPPTTDQFYECLY